MTYYINTQDHADDLLLDTLMEVLAAQAETNPIHRTMPTICCWTP